MLLEDMDSPYQHSEFPLVPLQDLTAISGINEALMGVDIPSGSSGRAIELKQKQSITHLAVIFDNLRTAKKKISNLLWGRRGHAGIISQFYTAEKVYRVEGANGQKFIKVNEQVIEQDSIAGTIVHTLNDLKRKSNSVGRNGKNHKLRRLKTKCR